MCTLHCVNVPYHSLLCRFKSRVCYVLLLSGSFMTVEQFLNIIHIYIIFLQPRSETGLHLRLRVSGCVEDHVEGEPESANLQKFTQRVNSVGLVFFFLTVKERK